MQFLSLLLRWARSISSGGIQGSGIVVAQELLIKGFDKIEVGNTFDVTITQSGLYDITVEADDNVLEYLDVVNLGETLRIRLQPGSSVRNATLRVKVALPELQSVGFSGASTARVTVLDVLDPVSLSGASKLTYTGGPVVRNLKTSGASTATSVN